MRINPDGRTPSDSAALADGDFVHVILVNHAVFFVRVVETTDVYLRVVLHSVEKPGQVVPLAEQADGDCLAIDTVFPWANVGLVVHPRVTPHDCLCLEA